MLYSYKHTIILCELQLFWAYIFRTQTNINQVLYHSSKCQKYFQNIFQFSDGYFVFGLDGCDLFRHFVESS